MLRVRCLLLFVLIAIGTAIVTSQGYGHFNGGTFSFSVRNDSNGKLVTDLDLITGWILEKGPCGPSCSKADIGKSTLNSRSVMITQKGDQLYFGNWTAEYQYQHVLRTKDLNTQIASNMKETVFAMNKMAKWEQELMQVTVELEPTNENYFEDIYFEGQTWHHLDVQSPTSYSWHMQAKIDSRIRSDTGKPNTSPNVLLKPFYRIKLDTIGKIHIAATDPDGDLIKCEPAVTSEGSYIAKDKIPGLTVYENCTVTVNASSHLNYHDDAWGAVALKVLDYNRQTVTLSVETIPAYSTSLCNTAVQFLVQVLAKLDSPEFVKPTADPNQHFILYAGTVWTQKIYAQSSENTTISEFLVLGRQQEVLNVSSIQDGPGKRVKFIEIKWTPKPKDIGNHIICITAIDDTGVDSAEDRCFTIEIKPDRFNHSSKPVADRPYFIDLPSFEQTVHCLRDVTCVLPLYVKSTEDVDTITVSQTYFKTTSCGPISKIQHNGEAVFKSDLSFKDSVDGVKKICLIAHSVKGHESDETCIQSKLDAPDPCASNPCENGGICIRSAKDPLAYACKCISASYSGKTCTKHVGRCELGRPCGTGTCYDVLPDDVYCDCTGTGFDGSLCSIKKDVCPPNGCNGNGICTTDNGSPKCNCYERFSGPNCATDNCNTTQAGIRTCEPLCASDPCHSHGICVTGGKCICSLGYNNKPTCDTVSGNISTLNNMIGTKFIPPSPTKASSIQCYVSVSNGVGLPCVFSVFVATSQSQKPTVTLDSMSPELRKSSSISQVSEVTYIPGLTELYTADVTVMGGTTNKDSYICLETKAGFGGGDRLCVQITYADNPEEQTGTAEQKEKNAQYKFISPTPNGDSRLICYVHEDCRTILHTNLNTQCEQVVTADQEVTVQRPVQNTGACVTEVSAKFTVEGKKHICFLSSLKPNSQRRCINIAVFSQTSNKCNAQPCQNDGDCFLMANNTAFCTCRGGYKGDHCEMGECTKNDNNCDTSAYCYTDGISPQCICPIATTGTLCRDRTSMNVQGSKFTDTAVPVEVTCVVNRLCAVPVGISSQSTYFNSAKLSFGFISPHVRTVGIATERTQSITSLKASVSVIPLEVGLKIVCVQTNVHNVNDDEVCINIKVTKDASLIYGFHDRPNFIQPSLPSNAEVKCPAGESCHVLYHVTPGEGHDKECTTVDFSDNPFKHGYVFTSCSNCIKGFGSNNCSIDASFIPSTSDIGTKQKVCLQAELTDAHLKGEERCFSVSIESKATFNVKKGCQTKKCLHGGFCDGHVNPPVCYCSSGYTGTTCDTPISGGGSGTTKSSFINNFGVPSALTCHVNTPCPVNFHLTAPPNSTPALSLGYKSPELAVSTQPTLQRQSTTEFIGTTAVTPTKPGAHKVCVQTGQSGSVHDEVCVTVQVAGTAAKAVDETKPYFIDPTPAAESTVVCKTGVTCYLEVFFDKASKFGGGNGCPNIEDTSPTFLDGIHIFEPAKRPRDCKTSIAYLPPATAKDKTKTICTQVVLPGKQGEKRCFNILVKDDVQTAVISPCKGKVCKNGGKCVADFTTTNPTSVCICPRGYTGTQCDPDTTTPKQLPGTTGTSPTSSTPHFDGASAIPKEIKCFKDEPCKIPIVYHGTHPPVLGYVDPHLITHGKPAVLPGGGTVTEVTATTTGTHKMCLQTTLDGKPDSENVDEVCVDVTISPGQGTPVNQTSPHFVDGTVPDKSRVYCNINANCHVPVYTKPTGTTCAPVNECPPGIMGVHVFETKLENGVCVTDTVYKTGASAKQESLCISAGPGGEERHVNIEVKKLNGFGPCQKVHCKNSGKCIADLSVTNPTAVCICKKGFEGTTCENNTTTPKQLPGTTGTSPTSSTPHFDGASAIPKEIKCFKGEPCKIPIVYHGTHPPVLGYVDPHLTTNGKPTVLPGGRTVTEVTATTTGTHKLCLQTTLDGTPDSENVDEVCVDVTISPGQGTPVNQTSPHFVDGTVPDKSRVYCSINANCHVPVYTKPKGHTCAPVNECPPGIIGVHVFETKFENGVCVTDTVYKTGASAKQESLCISAGPGGEERHVDIEVKKLNGFGPCQKVHCKHGGKCIADLSVTNPTAVCICKKGFEGTTCENNTPAPKELPGITGTSTTSNTHFDGTSAIPKEIHCETGKPCQIPIAVHGNHPPVLGYVDPRLSHGKPKILTGGVAVTEITAKAPGTHKVCLQTTAIGTPDSENVDEVCIDVKVSTGTGSTPIQSKPHFVGGTVPENTKVSCSINSNCHVPVYTAPKGGHCAPVSECLPGLKGVHVFETKLDNGVCITDTVYNTGPVANSKSLCITAGPGGEERHVDIEVKHFTSFGPCQTLHCTHGGKCIASPSAICVCKKGFEGNECATPLTTPVDLPGVTGGPYSAQNTPHFDGKAAIPKEVLCVKGEPCSITIPYEGSKPPKFGYVDPFLKSGTPKVISGNVVSELTANTTGQHKVCLQTTVHGNANGENVDEICVELKVSPGPSTHHNQNKPHFGGETMSAGSTVACNINTSCRIPVYTVPGRHSKCDDVSECAPGVTGVHVFETKLDHGICVTEAVIKTGPSPASNTICISAGPGGEERKINVETKKFTSKSPSCTSVATPHDTLILGGRYRVIYLVIEIGKGYTVYSRELPVARRVMQDTTFGPCQKVHCKNGGTCLADLSGSGNTKCVCPAYVSGQHCDVVSPCKGKTCNHGECIVHKNGSNSFGVCACLKGFEGNDCSTTSATPVSLPGVKNGPIPTTNTPRFDGSIAVPKEIVCHTNQPCEIPIPYHGIATKPPVFGHIDPGVTTTAVSVSGGPNPGPHTAVTSVTSTTPGRHRVCLQTTLDGAAKGENIDEICVEVNVKPGTGPPPPNQSKPHFKNHLPEGSTVTCNLDTNCHFPVVTKLTNGGCATVTECSPTIQGVKVFQTKPENGECVTDVVVRTSATAQTNQLCLSAGSGGEKRHVNVEATHAKGFGPCQTLHCKNNGKCDATQSGAAVCICPGNNTDPTCGGSCDSPPVVRQARTSAKSGMVSCWCTLQSGKRVEIIKKNPAPPAKKSAMAAAYGAGGMTGAMAVGAVIYVIVNKAKQPKVHPRSG